MEGVDAPGAPVRPQRRPPPCLLPSRHTPRTPPSMGIQRQEDYLELSQKTLLFLRTVLKTYNPKYILKVDDDVYIRPDRLPAAAAQWSSIHAGELGCPCMQGAGRLCLAGCLGFLASWEFGRILHVYMCVCLVMGEWGIRCVCVCVCVCVEGGRVCVCVRA